MSSSDPQSGSFVSESWTDEEWKQWQEFQASESRKAQFRKLVEQLWKKSIVLQSPWVQFGVVIFAQFLCFHVPSVLAVKEAIMAWSPQWLQFESLVYAVGCIQLLHCCFLGPSGSSPFAGVAS